MTKFRSWLTWHWLCRWGKILRCLYSLLELPPPAGSLENPLYFLEAENQTGYYSHPIRSWEEENWRWNCTSSLLNWQIRFLHYFLVGRKREYVRSVGEGRKVLVFTALSEVPLPFLPREWANSFPVHIATLNEVKNSLVAHNWLDPGKVLLRLLEMIKLPWLHGSGIDLPVK
jgi:hypothetical protein